jgi:tetratricopeptide (TPR) repeat protein
MVKSDADKWEAAEDGIELLRAGEVDDALVALLEAITEDPLNEYAHHFLGHAYFDKEAYPEALKCYVAALELAPDYAGAMIGAGQALRMMGEYDRALRMGHRVLQSRPEDPDALFLLGAIHFQRGENSAARKYLERFMHTNPELEVALEVEGMLQVVRGELLPFPATDDKLEN